MVLHRGLLAHLKKRRSRSNEERLVALTAPRDRNGCARFLGHISKKQGYGTFGWRSVLGRPCDRTIGAHVAAYRIYKGPVPRGLLVTHTCNNRWCVAQEHLVAGTQKQNMEHCVASRRIARGERQGGALMTWDRVRELRERYASGERQTALAEIFGISQPTVSQIVRGRTWREPVAA